MNYRRLGKTGLRVSELGFGCWGIGKTSWIGAEDESSVDALVSARDCGINFFDTALAYGAGRSERLLAKVFGKDHDVLIASKVPPKNMKWPAAPGTPWEAAFPKAHVLQCLRQTLINLGREAVDLYQFHVWSDEWANHDEFYETIREIRSEEHTSEL